jgi:hypothetical protein
MAMKHRKLRIAWSVAWGLAIVLMIALWVRSYWRLDRVQLNLPGTRGGLISSRGGRLRFTLAENISGHFAYLSTKISTLSVNPLATTRFGFAFESSTLAARTDVIIPDWIVVTAGAVFAMIPWLRSRFSLRSLLIATTLTAVGLGLIVWAAR